MNKKSLNTLEFTKIIKNLCELCLSGGGREKAATLAPTRDISKINLWQRETTESTEYIVKKGSLPLGGIHDIRESLKRLERAGILNVEELLGVSDFLYVCGKVITYGKNAKPDLHTESSVLWSLFSQIVSLAEIYQKLIKSLAAPNEVLDAASFELAAIRKNINISNNRIREALNSVIHSSSYKTMLQDAIITIRGDRFCVPVKQEYAKTFPGMVHDQSASGATVFIEPLSVVNLNNQIKELRAKEKAEIERILAELSADIAAYSTELTINSDILAHLDFVFAKGSLALAQDAKLPVFNNIGYVNISKGRHPLLDREKVVPTDIYIGKDFTTLLITGPNTGGKTVALKTLGLFTLMGQAGLHVPAKEAELAVFDNVFADIGDEQSIEQSLSTFSSHMSNITQILSDLTDNSLVLLDELGAGTDPTEGAALAIAILEFLRVFGTRTAVTTHYSELKVYALSAPDTENACCEFDVRSLSPTYKLLIGAPGKSNAFEISQRLGLRGDIITAAKDILSKESKSIEEIITDLEISRKKAEAEQERAEKYALEAERLAAEINISKAKQEEMREKILKKARQEAKEIFDNARKEADALLDEFKNTLKNGKQHEINEQKKIFRQKAAEPESVSYEPVIGASLENPVKEPVIGDKVYAAKLGKPGIITALLPNGHALVSIGNIKMKLRLADLYENKTIEKPQKQQQFAAQRNAQTIPQEIDLRGLTVNEATEACAKYIDDAYLANLEQIRIIHGKGTFTLMRAVTAFLTNHPLIKGHRQGEYGEGDSGVTIALINKNN